MTVSTSQKVKESHIWWYNVFGSLCPKEKKKKTESVCACDCLCTWRTWCWWIKICFVEDFECCFFLQQAYLNLTSKVVSVMGPGTVEVQNSDTYLSLPLIFHYGCCFHWTSNTVVLCFPWVKWTRFLSLLTVLTSPVKDNGWSYLILMCQSDCIWTLSQVWIQTRVCIWSSWTFRNCKTL